MLPHVNRAPTPGGRPLPTRARADGKLPADVTRPLLWGAVAMLAFRVLAATLPGRWLWGFDLGRDVGPWAFAASLLLPIAACVSHFGRAVASRWPSGRLATSLAAGASALALAIFMLAHPDLTLFTGDAALRHGAFSTVEHPEQIAQQAMRGDLFLHYTLPRWLAAATPWSAEDVGRGQGALLALLTALAGWRLAAVLGARGLVAAAVAAIAACGAALALDNGYAKATVEVACLTSLLAPGVAQLAIDGRGLGTVGGAVALALLLHRSALALVPVWLVGSGLAVRASRGREPATVLGIAAPVLALVLVAPHAWHVFTSFDVYHHVTAEGTAAPFAAALRPLHLLDVANALGVLSPASVLLPLLLLLPPRPGRRAAALTLALAGPPLALLLAVPPQQGLPRDWDVFAFAGSSLSAIAAWRVAAILAPRPRAHWVALPLALAVAGPALQWAALPSDPRRALERAEEILVGPPVRDREERAQGLARLGMTHYTRGDFAGGRRLFQRSLDVSPHPRMLVEWGLIANYYGHPDEALGYFRRSAAIRPDLASAWQGIADAAAALGDSASLGDAIAHLERLEPESAALSAARERLEALRRR